MTNIRACSQDNLPSRRSRIPVHSARFPLVSRAVVSNVGPPRMVSLHFCAWWTFCRSTPHVFPDSSLGVVRKGFPPRAFFTDLSAAGDGNLLHLAWFHCISVSGGRFAGLPRTFFLWFLARWSRMPVHPAHFCTLLHAFAHFSAFYPKRSLLFLVNYRSLLAFREETFA